MRNRIKKDATLVATTSSNEHKRMIAYNNRAAMREKVTLVVNSTYIEDVTPPDVLARLQKERGVHYIVTLFQEKKECTPFEAAEYLKGGFKVEIQ